MKKMFFVLFLLICLVSCGKSKNNDYKLILNIEDRKEIISFPNSTLVCLDDYSFLVSENNKKIEAWYKDKLYKNVIKKEFILDSDIEVFAKVKKQEEFYISKFISKYSNREISFIIINALNKIQF